MLGYLVLLLLALPLIALALTSRKTLTYYVLGTAAVPATMLLPERTFFGFIGGVNAQAAYLLMIFIALVVAALRSRERVPGRPRVLLPLVLFLAFAGASLFWSDDRIHGLRFLIKLAAPILMLAVTTSALRRDQHLVRAQGMVVFCCFVVLCLAVVNLGVGGEIGGEAIRLKWLDRGYLAAPYMGPAPFSFLMSIGVIVAFARWWVHRTAVNASIAVVLGTAVAMAFTRISLFGLVVACGSCSFVLGRTTVARLILPAVLVILFGVMVFFYEPLYSRMFFAESRMDIATTLSNPDVLGEAVNSSGRGDLWGAALEKFRRSSPYRGAGLGSVEGWLEESEGREQLHSGYLMLYLDLGAVGTGLFVFGFVNALVCCYRRGAVGEGRNAGVHRACGVAGLVFFGVTLATDNSLTYVSELGVYVFALVGCSVVSAYLGRQGVGEAGQYA